jgi:hypothetical protein
LWLDDLIRLKGVVSSIDRTEVRIEANGSEVNTDLEQVLPSFGPRLNEFKLTAYDPTTNHKMLILDLGPKVSWLTTENPPGIKVQDIASRIKSYTSQYTRPAAWVNTLDSRVATALVVAGGLLFGIVLGALNAPALAAIAFALMFVGYGYLLDTVLGRPLLYTAKRSNMPPFWTRNRDGMIVGILTGLITGAFFFFLSLR